MEFACTVSASKIATTPEAPVYLLSPSSTRTVPPCSTRKAATPEPATAANARALCTSFSFWLLTYIHTRAIWRQHGVHACVCVFCAWLRQIDWRRLVWVARRQGGALACVQCAWLSKLVSLTRRKVSTSTRLGKGGGGMARLGALRLRAEILRDGMLGVCRTSASSMEISIRLPPLRNLGSVHPHLHSACRPPHPTCPIASACSPSAPREISSASWPRVGETTRPV